MQKLDFTETVRLIVRDDGRFEPGAYHFVQEALDHVVRSLRTQPDADGRRQGRHVTGRELMEGLRGYALERFGPMTLPVFDFWRVRSTADFGDIVFNLIEYGIFDKTESDRREDFAGIYDFREAFGQPFEPRRRAPPVQPETSAPQAS